MNYPKPTALRLMEGRSPTNASEPKPIVASSTAVPRYLKLSKDEQAVWKRTAEILVRIGLLTEADYDALADYCRDYCWADRLRARIAAEGETVQITNRGGGESSIRNQAVTTLDDVQARLGKFRNEFGLNPVARTRVSVNAQKKDNEQSVTDYIRRTA